MNEIEVEISGWRRDDSIKRAGVPLLLTHSERKVPSWSRGVSGVNARKISNKIEI